MMPTREELKKLQAMSLAEKDILSTKRIEEFISFYGKENVCISFSGGKDSRVLLDLAKKVYPNIKSIFSDTGLEYPEIRDYVKNFDNVFWVKPKRTFKDVTMQYGYQLFSKEIAESIRYARKIVRGGGDVCQFIYSEKNCLERNFTQKNAVARQANCRRKKIQGVFRRARGMEQVNF